MRRYAPWLVVWGLTFALTAATTSESLTRYWEFRSGWSWDLAWHNQSLWALVKGDQILSVRPINSWGNEGPSIWSRTHLDPLRAAILPFYVVQPRPETLLVAHNLLLWLILPAAYGLARSESGSVTVGLTATAMVAMTPLLWPLAWNDFREMVIGLPFVLWAVDGFRRRHVGLSTFGAAGMLASREEYGVMLALLAFLPAKEPEDLGQTCRWARNAMVIGVGWVLIVFFGYQFVMTSHAAPRLYMEHFRGPKPTISQTMETAGELLLLGVGPWALFALARPRVAALAFPWIWGVANGRWALEQLSDSRWHHVRYTTPMVAMLLAAGLIGYARIGCWLLGRKRGAWWLAGVCAASTLWLLTARGDLVRRLESVPAPIDREEAASLWTWIDRVGPEDAVLASYEVSAPLSNRRLLYSNRMQENRPGGYPVLDRRFQWVFLRKGDIDPSVLTDQGFEIVFRGRFVWVYRRGDEERATSL